MTIFTIGSLFKLIVGLFYIKVTSPPSEVSATIVADADADKNSSSTSVSDPDILSNNIRFKQTTGLNNTIFHRISRFSLKSGDPRLYGLPLLKIKCLGGFINIDLNKAPGRSPLLSDTRLYDIAPIRQDLLHKL